MSINDFTAVETYIEGRPAFVSAYRAWQADPDTHRWVELIFPVFEDSNEKERYVLMYALRGLSDRDGTVEYAVNKARSPSVTASMATQEDLIAFFERFTLTDLQNLGI